jgi:hypothetical protein
MLTLLVKSLRALTTFMRLRVTERISASSLVFNRRMQEHFTARF